MESLKALHTFGFDSLADNVELITCEKDLVRLGSINTPIHILGGGSNTAFINDFNGTVVKVAIDGYQVRTTDEDFIVTLGAGEVWHDVLRRLMQEQVFGLENLALIPGTVGGAVVQNIGAYGVELSGFCYQIRGFNIREQNPFVFNAEACEFGYRDSVFKQLDNHYLITQVVLKIPRNNTVVANYGPLQSLSSPKPQQIFDEVVSIRKAKLPDPLVVGNAGSFFKNVVISTEHYQNLLALWPAMPGYQIGSDEVKVPTAWLLDTLGFKGRFYGGIGSYDKQPLVLINKGNGTGQELLTFSRAIKQKVYQTFQIVIENEVLLIGEIGEITL